MSLNPTQVSRAEQEAKSERLTARIDAILPQTQCRQCGYAGCRPYAHAIASGEADINQCPPGGHSGIEAIAALLGVDAKPLNPEHGLEQPRQTAVIDEPRCIGCTLCIQACPVDAIVGAAKLIHTVIAEECTGCRLCIAPCPVDCILMRPSPENLELRPGQAGNDHAQDADDQRARANRARRRFEARQARLEVQETARIERAQRQREALSRPGAQEVARAIERARARKEALAAQKTGPGTVGTEPNKGESEPEILCPPPAPR
jgi:electron transport complex protein RnfB